MKNLIFTILMALSATLQLNAQAISYQTLEWDIIKIGYVIPTGDNLSGGVSIATEPRYNVSDNISAGGRFEMAFFGEADDTADNVDVGAAVSLVGIGDYYFNTTSNNRPFAGLGVGLFFGGDISVDGNDSVDTDSGLSFGLVPRVGYELGFLRFAAEYNLQFKEGLDNYFGINVGFTLFGKYRG